MVTPFITFVAGWIIGCALIHFFGSDEHRGIALIIISGLYLAASVAGYLRGMLVGAYSFGAF